MNSEKGVYAILDADSTLKAMLNTVNNIHYGFAPQETLNPCIVISGGVAQTNETKDGVSKLDVDKIQVDAYCDTYTSVMEVAARIRLTLDGYSGTIGGIVIDSLIFTYGDIIYDDIAKAHRFTSDYQLRQKL